MNINRYYLFIFFLVSSSLFSYSQTPDSSKIFSQLPKNYYSEVDKKINDVKTRLAKKSAKYLVKFQRQERNLQRKVEGLHTGNAKNIFENAGKKYSELLRQIKYRNANLNDVTDGEYNPYLDSLCTSLSFLKQFNSTGGKIQEPLESLNKLQNKLKQSEKIKEFIAERKNQAKELLSKYTKIPGRLKREYDKLNRTAYYYSAQVREYKEILKDPKKAEQKTLNILNRLPVFQGFMKENGQLASLFRINENANAPGILTGLQTRSSVQEIIQQRITAGGPNAGQMIQQNIAQAKHELDKLKEKINQIGGESSDVEIPGFKTNNEKTKSFLKRLEYSANAQFAKTNSLLPSIADIGFGVGYKLNGKSTTGIEISYKVGMGSLRHISLTSQGMGFRSYMDWKIKKQVYASCGYEMNYNAAFKNIDQLKNYDAWQRAALAGISKRYKISKKIKGEVKLLYDFLANKHIPVSQAFLFRVGYKF